MPTTYSVNQIHTAVAALKAIQEKPFVSHEWEELVFCLSRDTDPGMRERMRRELDEILEKDPGVKVFGMN